MAKRKITIITATTAVIFLVIVGIFYYLASVRKAAKEKLPSVPVKEKTMEEVLRNLTAPAGQPSEVSEKVLKGLTAPKKGNPDIPEGILQSLTAP